MHNVAHNASWYHYIAYTLPKHLTLGSSRELYYYFYLMCALSYPFFQVYTIRIRVNLGPIGQGLSITRVG